MELKAASKCEIVNLVGCRLDGGELWVPQQKEIGSCKVMLLSKWDRGLTKFLTGKSLDFKKDKKTLNSTSAGAYLDALCDLRKKASLKAVQDAHANASDDEEPQPSSKRPRRVSNDMAHFQPLVEIMLPGVGDMEPKLVKVAFGVSNRDLWMEVDQSSLIQVFLGMKDCESCKGRSRKVKKSHFPASRASSTSQIPNEASEEDSA